MTLNFKRWVDWDIDNVFINGEEFADSHLIDGRELSCVVDSDLYQKRNSIAPGSVFASRLMLHISAEVLGYKPKQDQLMIVDGGRYIVLEVAENMGMFTITMEAAEQ